MDITMPQLGETVTEGTITKWLKQVGQRVEADEPLFEVSTDKVDSEVPSPVAGVVAEILVPEGVTVEVGARLAVLSDAAPAPRIASEPLRAPAAPPTPPAPASAPPAPVPQPRAEAGGAGVVMSPLVRRLVLERGLDPSQITGTGEGGRITRNDVLAAPVPAQPAAEGVPSTPASSGPQGRAPAGAVTPPEVTAVPSPGVARGDEVVAFSNIRRRTAEHMVRSKATSPHVYTSIEVDFGNVDRTRRAHQEAWRAREGFRLTYLPFIARAFCDAVDDYPRVNASVDGESLVVHHDIHLGIAVDLDFNGLVAPVIKQADGKRLRLLARDIRDLAQRARNKGLLPDDIMGGTFTITNMGPFGTLMTLPIINQPQVAILATDAIVKRPVVVEGPDAEDSIAVHPIGVLSLTWDHRAFDGAYAASFLRAMKDVIECRDWEVELA